MKKKVGFVLSILLGLSALGLGMYHTSASQAAPDLSEKQIKNKIQQQYPGKITEFELDKENNRAVYEAEVVQNGKEYDIVFDGNTGKVLSLEKQNASNDNDDSDDETEKDDDKFDKDDDNNDDRDDDKNNDNAEANNDKTSKEPRISAAKAQKIATNEVSGTVVSSELDEDDDRLIYEIEVKSDKKEAEFEIDAYTGNIIVMSIDKEKNDDHDDRHDRDDNNDEQK